MSLLISLVLAELFLRLCAKPLKERPAIFYGGAALISAAVIGLYWAAPEGISPSLLNRIPIWLGALGTAFFIEVMVMGALPNGHPRMKQGMPIRGELSIFACLLTLGHNLSYGKNYLTPGYLFTGPFSATKAAAWVSAVLIVLMLVLTVTSVKKVRRRIPPKRWKALQRWAYLFYGLIYVHVLLLNIPGFLKGRSGCGLTLLVYSVVFLSYALCRVRKALLTRGGNASRVTSHTQWTAVGMGAVLSLLLVGGLRLYGIQAVLIPAAPQVSDVLPQSLEAQAPEPSFPAAAPVDSEEPEPPAEETNPPETVSPETVEPESAPKPTEPAEQAVEPAGMSADTEETPKPEASQMEEPPKPEASQLAPAAVSEPPLPDPTTAPAPETAPPEPEPTPAEEPEPVTKYQDGTFSGTGEGYYGPVTVSVTISGDLITAIHVDSYIDDDDYFGDAQSAVIPSILSAQSPEVSAVSGATYSSRGIMAAVRNALAKAQNG